MNLEIIKKLAEKRDGGLKKLASDIGMTEQNLHRCIRFNKIQASDLEKIAILFDVDVNFFFNDNQQEINNNSFDNMSVRDRLIIFIKSENLSISRFEKTCGLSNGYVKSITHSIGSLKLEQILENYPNLNRQWLITGEGEMLRETEQTDSTVVEDRDEWKRRAEFWMKMAEERLEMVELQREVIQMLKDENKKLKASAIDDQTRTA